MNLRIKNFAKIAEADINIDGLTVIAGYNNAGKSTVGKILFALFNSFYNIENKVKEERTATLSVYIGIIINTVFNDDVRRDFLKFNLRHDIAAMLVAEYSKISMLPLEHKKTYIKGFIKSVILQNEELQLDEAKYNEISDSVIDKLIMYLDIENNDIENEITLNYFAKIFNNQVNSLYNSQNAELDLTINQKSLSLSFANNKNLLIKKEFNILHEAFYIDNPFIVDELSEQKIILLNNNYLSVHENLLTKIKNAYEEDVNVLDSILVKDKFAQIHNVLENALNVNIEKTNKGFFVNSRKFSSPMHINNLSTGLKAFAVLQILLEKSILKEKDVLVLDEPEVHLHPEWQLVYAELIVLLQKYFDLSIIMTTHSPYFLDAINLYSEKHKIADKVNYYLSYVEDDQAKFKNVNNDMESIYSLMAAPFNTLDTMRYTAEE